MARGRAATMGVGRKYAYAWLTVLFFTISIAGHWYFGWRAYVTEQTEFHHSIQLSDYATQWARDMFENWQSEFLQLLWQVCGLAFFLYVGSPQSKEGDDRHEAKLDAILQAVDPKKAEDICRDLEKRYPKN
jgi:uncharacterized protein DUF6766